MQEENKTEDTDLVELPKKEEGSLIDRMLNMIKEAREQGATPAQLDELRKHMRLQTGFHPTKKRTTLDQRKKKRMAAKAARKVNRGLSKGYVNRKGQRWTKQG